MYSEPIPAVLPCTEFDPVFDAKTLHSIIRTKPLDNNAIINIICERSNLQRQLLQHHYQQQYNRNLIGDLKTVTCMDFKNLLVALLTPVLAYHAEILHDAIAGIVTNESALIEFLCGYEHDELEKVAQIYHQNYKSDLRDDITSITSGLFQKILIAQFSGRDKGEAEFVDCCLGRREAELLLQAGELKCGTNKTVFLTVFCRRGYHQLRFIAKEYKRMKGHLLSYAIETQFSGNVRNALRAILSAAIDRSEYFAQRLHKSMAGLGTDDKQLIRVIVSRSEVDLISVRYAFENLYGKSLKTWIIDDTSGDYRNCLLTLIRDI